MRFSRIFWKSGFLNWSRIWPSRGYYIWSLRVLWIRGWYCWIIWILGCSLIWSFWIGFICWEIWTGKIRTRSTESRSGMNWFLWVIIFKFRTVVYSRSSRIYNMRLTSAVWGARPRCTKRSVKCIRWGVRVWSPRGVEYRVLGSRSVQCRVWSTRGVECRVMGSRGVQCWVWSPRGVEGWLWSARGVKCRLWSPRGV